MHRFFLVGVLFLAGCSGNIIGPFGHRAPERVDDPLLTINEQEVRGRDRLPLWDESTIKMDNLAPRTYIDRPSPSGR